MTANIKLKILETYASFHPEQRLIDAIAFAAALEDAIATAIDDIERPRHSITIDSIAKNVLADIQQKQAAKTLEETAQRPTAEDKPHIMPDTPADRNTPAKAQKASPWKGQSDLSYKAEQARKREKDAPAKDTSGSAQRNMKPDWSEQETPAKPSKLPAQQHAVLQAICDLTDLGHNQIDGKSIAAKLDIDIANMTTVLNPLEEKGYITSDRPAARVRYVAPLKRPDGSNYKKPETKMINGVPITRFPARRTAGSDINSNDVF